MASTGKRGRQGVGQLIAVTVGLGVLLLAGWLGSRLWRSVLAPWSDDSGKSSTLQGDWAGPVALADGTTGSLYLTLVDTVDGDGGFERANLEGVARYCLGDATGDFELVGRVTPDGSIDWLEFQSFEAKPAWLFHTDAGQYSGERLTLSWAIQLRPQRSAYRRFRCGRAGGNHCSGKRTPAEVSLCP